VRPRGYGTTSRIHQPITSCASPPGALACTGGTRWTQRSRRNQVTRAAARTVATNPSSKSRRAGRTEPSLPLTLSRPACRRSPAQQALTDAFAERPVVQLQRIDLSLRPSPAAAPIRLCSSTETSASSKVRADEYRNATAEVTEPKRSVAGQNWPASRAIPRTLPKSRTGPVDLHYVRIGFHSSRLDGLGNL
jgi:hypothetical protein